MIKLAVISRNSYYLENLLNLLQRQKDIKVIDTIVTHSLRNEVERIVTFGEQMLKLRPNIILLDMPTVREFATLKLDIIDKYSEKRTIIKPIIISRSFDPKQVMHLMKLGVRGFLLRENFDYNIVKCIRAVAKDEFELSEPLKSLVLDEFIRNDRKQNRRNSFPATQQMEKIHLLSRREIEILELVSESMTNDEIAQQLFLKITTVKTHIRNIFDKTGVRNRVEASRLYIRYSQLK